MDLTGKRVLITGAAVRIGRAMSLAVAQAGGEVIAHYGGSKREAGSLKKEIEGLGGKAHLIQADLSRPSEAKTLISRAAKIGTLYAVVNSAAIFGNTDIHTTSLKSWQGHMDLNLTAPFLISQSFWKHLTENRTKGRIVNILDWRALRPGPDHLPYTISKAALAALTSSLATAMAPKVTVNGLAFGAILPPKGGAPKDILEAVPAGRWANLDEVGRTLLFLLTGPDYITGEIIHLDGGRHLV